MPKSRATKVFWSPAATRRFNSAICSLFSDFFRPRGCKPEPPKIPRGGFEDDFGVTGNLLLPIAARLCNPTVFFVLDLARNERLGTKSRLVYRKTPV